MTHRSSESHRSGQRPGARSSLHRLRGGRGSALGDGTNTRVAHRLTRGKSRAKLHSTDAHSPSAVSLTVRSGQDNMTGQCGCCSSSDWNSLYLGDAEMHLGLCSG